MSREVLLIVECVSVIAKPRKTMARNLMVRPQGKKNYRPYTPTTTFQQLSVVKKKVKVTLVQTLRLCTGRTVYRGNRGIALLRLCTGRTAHRGSRGIAILKLCTGRKAYRGSRGIALLRLCTGRTAHRGSRGIAILFHDQRH